MKANLPQGVTLQKLEPHSWMMDAGDKRPGARYKVLLNGQDLGEVEKCSEASYRSDNTTSRVRYGLLGYGIYWRAARPDHQRVGYRYYSRASAIEALLEGSL